jgi:hypothetical protein
MEPRVAGRQMLQESCNVKRPLREFLQRINKEKRLCGNATEPNTGSGV